MASLEDIKEFLRLLELEEADRSEEMLDEIFGAWMEE